MSYVTVNVDLDEFETYELCDELIKRLNTFRKNKLTDKQKKEVTQAIAELAETVLNVYAVPNKTFEDRQKIEWLKENWDKFNSWDLDKIL